jgi:hypothetical protein
LVIIYKNDQEILSALEFIRITPEGHVHDPQFFSLNSLVKPELQLRIKEKRAAMVYKNYLFICITIEIS